MQDSLSGTAQVRDGKVELTFGLPINCFDATHTTVVHPDIGTTAVNASLDVETVEALAAASSAIDPSTR